MKRLYSFLLTAVMLSVSCLLPHSVHAQNRTQGGWPTMQKKFPLLSYQEMPPFAPGDSVSWAAVKEYRFAWGETGRVYPRTQIPEGPLSRSLSIDCWRGEHVMAQAVLWTRRHLKDLSAEMTDLKGARGIIPGTTACIGWVRSVLVGRNGFVQAADSLLIPDCIDGWTQGLGAGPGQTQGIWVDLPIPATAAGRYSGELILRSRTEIIARLPLTVLVSERELPPLTSDEEWLVNPYSIARYYHLAEWKTEYETPWSEGHFAAMRPLMERLVSLGQHHFAVAICHDPFLAQAEDPFLTMVSWMHSSAGWSFSFEVLDRYIAFMTDCGLDGEIRCYGAGEPLRYYDLTTDRMDVLPPEDARYKVAFQAFLEAFRHHLSEKGWDGRAVFALDPHADAPTKDLATGMGFRTAKPATANYCSWPLEPLFDSRFIPASLERAGSGATAGTSILSAKVQAVSRTDVSGTSPATLPYLVYPGNRPSVRLQQERLRRQQAAK